MTTTASRVAGLLAPARDADTPDAELVRRFAGERDDLAFVALVRRHGPMVFGVCRRVLRDWHLAEDAFQAAFVVLARRASAISPPGAVAGWLHGVAYRVAKDARRSASRRFNRERTVGELPDAAAPPGDPPDGDLAEVIDAELHRLPAKYRELLVACDLEGRPRQPVAEALGIPEGTLSSRLTAARRMLADRLARRGIAPAVVAAVAAGESVVRACELPRALLASAARIGSDATGTVPGNVAALASGAIRAMTVRTFLPYAAGLLVVVSAALAVAARAPEPPRVTSPKPAPLALAAGEQPAPAKVEPKPLPQGPGRLLVHRASKFDLIDPDGKNAKTVAESTGTRHQRDALLSPDGKYLALLEVEIDPTRADAIQPQPTEAKPNLVIKELGSDTPATDLKVSCKMFAWSPDGTEIVCCDFTDRSSDDTPPKFSHFIVNVKTKKQTPLRLPENHLVTDWSRDGKHFLTTSFKVEGKKPAVRLHLMNRDGTEHEALGSDTENAMVGRLSPDGTRVLCFRMEFAEEKKAGEEAGGRRQPPRRVLALLDVATGKLTPVADVPLNGEIQGFCWSPDGKKIAYTWRVLHEGKPEDLIEKETESHLVVCDPDGTDQKTILTEKGQGQWHITLASVHWR